MPSTSLIESNKFKDGFFPRQTLRQGLLSTIPRNLQRHMNYPAIRIALHISVLTPTLMEVSTPMMLQLIILLFMVLLLG